MKVDILLCIDGTASMKKIIDEVKGNISSFVNNLIKNLTSENLEIEAYRIKIIVFRNLDFDGDSWYQETPFYDLEKNQLKLDNFLSGVEAVGGSPDTPFEDGLSALSIGISNSNWSFGPDDIQIIGLWTDTESKDLNAELDNFKPGTPNTYDDLKKYWVEYFLIKAPKARLLLFAPDVYPWNNILEEWPQSIHYRSSSAGIDYENPETFLIKDLLLDLTPSVIESNYSLVDKKDENESVDSALPSSKNFFQKVSQFWKKYSRAVTISAAILSISLISFRVVGFSIFSVNLKYSREVNDANTREFQRRLDEITQILKTQGLLQESTEVGFTSEIETRHGWFYDDYDLVLKYSLELSIDDYNLGQYTISEIRETKVAAEIITDHLNIVEDTYLHDGPIRVKVIGETDATPIRGAIPYNGVYGKILSTSFIYQGEKHALELRDGENLKNNIELGVLRASELWHYVKSATNLFIPKETFLDLEVITHSDFGGTYRKSTIIVKLYDLKEMD